MDRMVSRLMHEDLTGKILGACFEVADELGYGFLEAVYEKSLLLALRQRGLEALPQAPLKVLFRGHVVGEYYADVLVDGKVLVELKAVSNLVPEHQAQLITYLRAKGLPVGLLVNFGSPKLQYKRCVNPAIKRPAPTS